MNLKNVNPVENMSLFQGSNSPNPDFECIINSSGDIYKIVPLALVLAKVPLFYLDSPKSDNFIIYYLDIYYIKFNAKYN